MALLSIYYGLIDSNENQFVRNRSEFHLSLVY